MSEALTHDLEGGARKYNDRVETPRSERWQKHGHDRIYPESAKSGYVDLNAGEVVELIPHIDTGVAEYELSFDPERDALVLKEVPTLEMQRKRDAEPQTVAVIPTGVFNK